MTVTDRYRALQEHYGPTLGPVGLATYLVLSTWPRHGSAPSMRTLAARMGVSTRTAQRAVYHLAALHLLEIQPQVNARGSWEAHRYQVLDPLVSQERYLLTQEPHLLTPGTRSNDKGFPPENDEIDADLLARNSQSLAVDCVGSSERSEGALSLGAQRFAARDAVRTPPNGPFSTNERLAASSSKTKRPRVADSTREQVLGLLKLVNTIGKRNFEPVEANLDFIRARLAEYGDWVLAAMVRRQWANWKARPEMLQYFRPATLFNAEKCAQYVGQLTDQDRAWIVQQQAEERVE